MNYYHTVKTLLESGNIVSKIAMDLGIDRKTVRKIREGIMDKLSSHYSSI